MFEHAPPIYEVDVLTCPDAVAAELAHRLPRGEDTPALLLLDPATLPDPGRVDLLVAFERHLALLQAAQQQVLAALDGRALDRLGTKLIDYTREQVGAALRLWHRRTAVDDRADPGLAATRHPEPAAHRAADLPAREETRRSRHRIRRPDCGEARAAGTDPGTRADPAPIRGRTAPRRNRSRPAPSPATPRRRDRTAAGGVHRARPRHHEPWALLPADSAALIQTVLNSLATDQSGTSRRLVTDDTGQLRDHGRRTYRPPANLTNHLITRDQTCTFSGWRVRRRQDGSHEWSGPTGHRYLKPPDHG